MGYKGGAVSIPKFLECLLIHHCDVCCDGGRVIAPGTVGVRLGMSFSTKLSMELGASMVWKHQLGLAPVLVWDLPYMELMYQRNGLYGVHFFPHSIQCFSLND